MVRHSCIGERNLILSTEERSWAKKFFKEKLHNSDSQPVGIFVGGRYRKGKSWDISNFSIITHRLRSRVLEAVVFIGPEEISREEPTRAVLGQALYIKESDILKV